MTWRTINIHIYYERNEFKIKQIGGQLVFFKRKTILFLYIYSIEHRTDSLAINTYDDDDPLYAFSQNGASISKDPSQTLLFPPPILLMLTLRFSFFFITKTNSPYTYLGICFIQNSMVLPPWNLKKIMKLDSFRKKRFVLLFLASTCSTSITPTKFACKQTSTFKSLLVES